MAMNPEIVLASRNDAVAYIDRGMQEFRQGKVSSSVVSFDKALTEFPDYKSYLWQRGLSLYYNQDYKACSEQFRADVAVNPLDTEEAVWAMLCESKLNGDTQASAKNIIQLPAKDRRPYMAAIYKAFRSPNDENALSDIKQMTAVDSVDPTYFYTNLYYGLLLSAKEDPGSNTFIKRALESGYASKSNDYMVAVARVQLAENAEDRR